MLGWLAAIYLLHIGSLMSGTPKFDKISFPICLDGQVPAGLQSVFDSAPRSPAEQLRWLRSQAPFKKLADHLAQARVGLEK
jgi:hypothetical protein